MIDEIVQIISNMGFPIACCVFLYLQMNKQNETHKEEFTTLSSAIENNTIAITKLCERLSDKTDKVSLNE